jgi:hypothetical protein
MKLEFTKRKIGKCGVIALLLFVGVGESWGQAFNFTAGNLTYIESFDVMGSGGTALITGWESTDATIAVNTGTTTSGGVYNIGSSGDADRAIGTIASGSISPRFGANFTNNTGTEITQVDFAGVMEQWRSGNSNTANEIVAFEYSLDASSLITGTWTAISSMDLVEKLTATTSGGAVNGNDIVNKTTISGSASSISWSNGATLWIRWSDNNDAGSDGIYAIDDFSMTVTLGASTTSTLADGAGTEPSSVSSLINTQGASSLNFDFTYEEKDAVVTQISQIIFKQGTGNQIADWSEAILGAELSDGINSTILATINAANITFGSISNGSGQLGEIIASSTKTYQLKIWLRTDIPSPLSITIDGSDFVFKVDNGSFTFDAGGLATGESVSSPDSENVVEVAATELQFSNVLTSINVATDFGLSISATDANGNVDTGNNSSSITLSKNSGSGAFTSTTTLIKTLASGVASWADLQNDATGSFTISADDGAGLTDAISSSITVNSPPTTIVIQDFEGTATDGWEVATGFSSSTENSGGNFTPSGESVRNGSSSFQSSNTTSTLEFASQNISSFNNVSVEIWNASISVTSGNGIDGGDDLKVYVSETATFGVTPDITVIGNNNARFGMSGTGEIIATAGTPLGFTYSGGGTRTGNDAKSKLTISIPDAWNTVFLKIETDNNSTGEIWCLDDISLIGSAVVVSGTSDVVAGGGTESTAISSLTTTTSLGDGYQTNFDFTVRDDGATAGTDALPALISQIIVNQGAGNDIADWTTVFSAVNLVSGSEMIAGAVNASNITFSSIPNGTGTALGFVGDNATKTYELKVVLQNLLPANTDNMNVAFVVDRNGFIVEASGSSGFETGAGTVVESGGGNNEIQIIATNLEIVSEPTSVFVNEDFSLTVNATDVRGNVDADATPSVTLARGATGTGTLSSATGLVQNLSGGTFTWADLQFDTEETFNISTSSILTDNTSDDIVANEIPQLIIAEIADPNVSGATPKFVKLYNGRNTTIDFDSETFFLSKQANGSTNPTAWFDLQLTGSILPGQTFVITDDATDFSNAYGSAANMANGNINGNGDDTYYIYEGGDHTSGTLIDIYGEINQDGTGEAWEYTDSRVVRIPNSSPNTIWVASEWVKTASPTNATLLSTVFTPLTHGYYTTPTGDLDALATWGTSLDGGDEKPTDFTTDNQQFYVLTNTSATVSANWTISGLNTELVIGNSVTATSFSVPASFSVVADNLVLTNASDITVVTNASLSANQSFTNLGTITVESGASFIQTATTPTNTGSGTYTMNRVGDDYHGIYNYWSSPVPDATIGGVFPTTNSKSRYMFDTSIPNWVGVGDGTTMTAGLGYIATGKSTPATTITRAFSSTTGFNSGDITASVINNAGGADDDWNLVGNPYPSSFSANAFLNDPSNSSINNGIHLWVSDGSDYSSISSDYAVMDAAGVTNGRGVFGAGENFVPAGQGFFVEANTTGTVTFKNSHRSDLNNGNFARAKDDNLQKIWLNVTANDGITNELSINFSEQATVGEDRMDITKFKGNKNLAFYSLLDKKELIVQGLPELIGSQKVKLGLDANESGKYEFNINHLLNFSENFDIFLLDKELGISTDLRAGNYVVQLESAIYKERFELEFVERVLSVDPSLELKGINIMADEMGINLYFTSALQGKEFKVGVYNLSGKRVLLENITSSDKEMISVKSYGILIVRVEGNKGVMTKKIFLNK